MSILRPPTTLFLRPYSALSSSSCSLVLVPWRNNHPGCPLIHCPRSTAAFRGRTLIVRAHQSFDSSDQTDDNNNPNAESSMPKNGTFKSRREILLEYVQNVEPEFMDMFMKRAPRHIVDAMRQTVMNMIGFLPPEFFAVTVTAVAENLAQLMYSVLMTGYMFRNAQYRIELQQSLDQVSLPETQKQKDAPKFAPGSQKKVSGEVIRWNDVSGPEKVDAVKYIELLEAEIKELNRQIERKSADEEGYLMAYLRTLEPENLRELASTAGEDVILAMNTFIKRLLAVSESQMKTTVTETSAQELSKLLYWLMVVGYSIRNIEVLYDMERKLDNPMKLAELPPGENL